MSHNCSEMSATEECFKSFKHVLKGKHPIILGGHFNCVVDVALDKSAGNDMYGNLASLSLVNVCNAPGLCSVLVRAAR